MHKAILDTNKNENPHGARDTADADAAATEGEVDGVDTSEDRRAKEAEQNQQDRNQCFI